MKKFRLESDSFGELRVPKEKYYGAQSARSLSNFPIGIETMPQSLIRALGIVKHSAANVNIKLGVLDKGIGKAIKKASKEVTSIPSIFANSCAPIWTGKIIRLN